MNIKYKMFQQGVHIHAYMLPSLPSIYIYIYLIIHACDF